MALAAFLLPALNFKANRLLAGEPTSWLQLHPALGWAAVALWGALLLASFFDFRGKSVVYSLLSAAGLLTTGLLLGHNATDLMGQGTDFSRVSLGFGAWLMVLALYVLAFALEQERRFFSVPLLLVLVGLLARRRAW